MSKAAFVAAVCLTLASSAFAKERDGVQLPETAQVEGKTLKLNGAGTRVKVIFKVYVASLYLESTTKNAGEAISSDQTKRVVLVMLRDLDKQQIAEAIREGFVKNAPPSQMPALKDRLDKLTGMFTAVKKGQNITVTYVPGKGTIVADSNGEKGTLPGKDFADALFSVWLGKDPVDGGLKKDMLGE